MLKMFFVSFPFWIHKRLDILWFISSLYNWPCSPGHFSGYFGSLRWVKPNLPENYTSVQCCLLIYDSRTIVFISFSKIEKKSKNNCINKKWLALLHFKLYNHLSFKASSFPTFRRARQKYYVTHGTTANFDKALKFCSDAGGTVVLPRSEEQNQALAQLLVSCMKFFHLYKMEKCIWDDNECETLRCTVCNI
uniref:C-type lectin domain-containing protein n=1 Tax=Electrophorus electricus TaxID=8005 RepID=A0AAY5F4Y1_ELEEL